MTEEDPDVEWARSVRDLFRGLYEDGVILQAETGLNLTPDMADVQMPNTSHPAYSHIKIDFEKAGQTIRVMGISRLPLFMSEEEQQHPQDMASNMRIGVLTRRSCVGPAPFIGDPRLIIAAYTWNVWMDDYGRGIASDAKLNWYTSHHWNYY